jgi:hypothetical protein
MKCPQCGYQNKPGISICDKCDFILDASFLGDADGGQEAEEPPELDESTQSGPPPKPSRTRPSQTQAAEPPQDDGHPHKRGSRFIAGGIDDPVLEGDPMAISTAKPKDDDDWRAELRREREQKAAEAAQQARDAPPARPQNESDRIVGDLKSVFAKGQGAYKGLTRADQLSVAGAGLMFLMCFFPWVSIERQGSLVGLEVGGLWLLLLAGCVGGAVFLRRTAHWQSRPKPIVLGQAGALALSLVFILSKITGLNSMRVVVPEADLEIPAAASVQFGIFLALVGAAVAAYGTWQIFRQEVLKKP